MNQIKVINTSAELVQNAIRERVGRKAGFLIPKYRNYTIEKINGEFFFLSRQSGKVKLGKMIRKDALGDAMKAYCIAKKNKTAAYLYAGSCEFRKKNYVKAEKYFKKAGPLSKFLLGKVPKPGYHYYAAMWVLSEKAEIEPELREEILKKLISKFKKGHDTNTRIQYMGVMSGLEDAEHSPETYKLMLKALHKNRDKQIRAFAAYSLTVV